LPRSSLANAAQLQQLRALQAENAQLRELIEARKRVDIKVLAAEVLYAARDPFSRKIIVDRDCRRRRGRAGGNGRPRRGRTGDACLPVAAEVTLSHVTRASSCRSRTSATACARCSPAPAARARWKCASSRQRGFQNGDRLATQGIDGVYPPGLPVAEVANVERNAAQLFSRITANLSPAWPATRSCWCPRRPESRRGRSRAEIAAAQERRKG